MMKSDDCSQDLPYWMTCPSPNGQADPPAPALPPGLPDGPSLESPNPPARATPAPCPQTPPRRLSPLEQAMAPLVREAQTVLSRATAEQTQAMEAALATVASTVEARMAALVVASGTIEEKMDQIQGRVGQINDSVAYGVQSSMQEAQTFAAGLSRTAEQMLASMKRQEQMFAWKLLATSWGVATVAAAATVLTLSWSRPEWVLTELQEQEISAGRELIKKYHTSTEAEQRRLETLMDWKSPQE